MFSRFTLGCFIDDKHPETVIDCTMQNWVGVGMGSPKKFLADNGGELANPNFNSMCKNLNIHFLH